MLFCSVFQDVFGHFPIISEDFRRCPKTTELFQQEIRSSLSPRNSVWFFLTGPRWIALKGREWPRLYAFRKQNPPRFYRSSLELWQHRRRIHSMPPSASTLSKGSWAPDTRLIPSTAQNTVANGWKNETTATAPLRTGSKFTGDLSRAKYGVSTKALQTLNSIFSGNSKH